MATWLESDGTAGIASAPGSSIDLSGDADLRIRARAVDWSPPVIWMLLCKRDTGDIATGEWHWSLEANLSSVRWRWIDNAAANLTQVFGNHGGVDNAWVSLRMTFDADNGSGSRVLTLYTREDDDIASDAGWTPGTPSTIAGATNIRTGAATICEIGSQNNGGTGLFVGGVAKALVISGLSVAAGTVVASPDFTNLPAGATSYEDAQGNVWTFRPGVSIQGLAQKLYPAAIVETNSWTGAATDIDEPDTPSDADFIESPSSPTTAQPIVLKSQGGVDPTVHTGHQVTIRARRNIISGTPTVSLTPVWRTGYVNAGSRGTVVKTGSEIALTDAFADYTVTLSEAEAANIPSGEYASGVFLELIPNQT